MLEAVVLALRVAVLRLAAVVLLGTEVVVSGTMRHTQAVEVVEAVICGRQCSRSVSGMTIAFAMKTVCSIRSCA